MFATISHNWFVLIKDKEEVEELARTLVQALEVAKKEGKILKIQVQEMDIEDTF